MYREDDSFDERTVTENERSENCWQTILKRISRKDKINFSTQKRFKSEHLHKSKTKKRITKKKNKNKNLRARVLEVHTKTVHRMYKSIKRKSYDWNEQKSLQIECQLQEQSQKQTDTRTVYILI